MDFCLVQVRRRDNRVLDASSVISLIWMAYQTIQIPVELDSVYFVTCPKQGLEIEAVVLHRVAFLEYFCPKQGQDFKPLAAPLYRNMGQVRPPPPGPQRPVSRELGIPPNMQGILGQGGVRSIP